MVKHARLHGIVGDDLAGDDLPSNVNDLFWEAVEKNEIFVFAPAPAYETPKECPVCTETLDQPFPVWSIEVAGRMLTSPNIDGDGVSTCCLMMFEGGGSFSFVKVFRPEIEKEESYYILYMKDHSVWAGLAKVYIDRLSDERDGVELTDDVVMIPRKEGNKKKPHKIRRIFHVCPHKNTVKYTEDTKRNVDWTHRWSVRGCWVHFWADDSKTIVDVSRIGKDRNGDYCVLGKTWRIAHVKGPEQLPAVKKVRVVKP